MPPSTVLILGGDDDEHAMHVARQLHLRGIDVELVDSRWFPQWMSLSFNPALSEWTLVLPSGRRVVSGQVRSVYWRSYDGVETPELADAEQTWIAHHDSRSLFESWLIHMPTRWVNGWNAFQSHQTKPVQLALVASLGIRVPRTLLTNHGSDAVEFSRRVAPAIFKPVQGGDQARRLTDAHLQPDNLKELRLAPITIQEEIAGTNIRVFVAGDRVLACEIRTDQVDYRQDDDAKLIVHDLSADVAESSRRLATALQLRWTGIDFRLTPDGDYVFLEANPSPMFLGFESQTGLPLTEGLLELLI